MERGRIDDDVGSRLGDDSLDRIGVHDIDLCVANTDDIEVGRSEGVNDIRPQLSRCAEDQRSLGHLS